VSRGRWVLPILLVLWFLSACGSPKAETPMPFSTVTTTPSVPPPSAISPAQTPTSSPPSGTRMLRLDGVEITLYEGFEARVTADSRDENRINLCVRSVGTGKAATCIDLPAVSLERRGENTYLVWIVGYTPGSSYAQTLELWRYDAEGKGTRLYSAPGLSFRVAPDEQYIALRVSDPGGRWETLRFIDSAGNPVQEFTADQLTAHDEEVHAPLPARLALLDWSDNGKTFWGYMHAGPSPQTIFRINTDSWQVALYDVSDLSIPWEYDLNVDTAKLAYSDCPQMYVAEDAEAFARSQRRVTLFVYDLDSGRRQIVATAVAECFQPRWLDDTTLEYNDPEDGGRTTYVVEESR